MNVLAVIPQYVPWSRVGSWVTTHEYLAGLVARGHRVDVVVIDSTRPAYDVDGVHVHPNGTDVPAPDVVVSHLGDDHEGARLAQRLGVPSVRMVHGYGPNAMKLDQVPTALAVMSSQALADETGWDGPTLVAHPPVHKARYRVKSGTKVTLSNLSVAKGGLLLGWIADGLPDTEFVGVLGWGRQMQRQPANVEIVDPVEDMRSIYRQTRVLLMPSDRETYGRVGVEAACSGIPTIAHPSPGLVEALGDSATWVDRSDRNGWVRALSVLEDPDAWAAASKRARRAVQADPDATIATVADAIESVLVAA